MADENRIVLDSSSFKALASETRVLILKELDKKRSTASELAKALGLSAQSVSEHLENMRVAGLVERMESGRKWVYFQLTEKGKAVLHPESKKFWIILPVVFLLVATYALFFMQPNSFFPQAQGGIAASDSLSDSFTEKQSPPALDGVRTAGALPLNYTNSTGNHS